jgi:hypothetical protein
MSVGEPLRAAMIPLVVDFASKVRMQTKGVDTLTAALNDSMKFM